MASKRRSPRVHHDTTVSTPGPLARGDSVSAGASIESEALTHAAARAGCQLNGGEEHRACGPASIHLIRVPDLEMRKRALRILISTADSWVRLPGNVLGVSTLQVDALKQGRLDFEWVSKAPVNA